MPPKSSTGINGVFEKPVGSGVYWIRYYDSDKKKKVEKVGTKAAAAKLVAMRKVAVMEGRKIPKRKEVTIGQLVERYSKEILSRNEKSASEYRRHGDFWTSELGKVSVNLLTPGRIESWKADQILKQSGSTVNGKLRYLKMLINLAIRDKLVDDNPLSKGRVKLARESPPRDRIVMPLEEKQLEASAPRDLWLQILVGLNTGLRQSEHFDALRSDIDLDRRLWLLPDEKGNRTGANVTWLKINQVAAESLRELFTMTDGAFVYNGKSKDGKTDGTSVTKKFQRLCDKLGFPPGLVWHSLRHTFISRLCMMGVPLPTVQKLARHKTIAMTLRYAHLCPSHEDSALDALSGYGKTFDTPMEEKNEQS